MKRRDFLVTTALGAGATALLEGCGHQEERLIPFLISEEELVPGVQYWTASVCRQCPAGCGILVKTMLGEATTRVDGQVVKVKVRQAKKIEGNPDHPLNRGKLCARGQAGLQVLYNPDRIQGPLKRTGPRGSDQYAEITWDEAIATLATKLGELHARHQAHTALFLTGHLPGYTRTLVERFMQALGSPNHITHELFGDEAVRTANQLTMGRRAFVAADLEKANYLLSFSATFLETWRSPVRYNLGFGELRQGRPGVRGKVVHAEPRCSMTAANADEWLPIQPGSEGALALGLAHVIIKENLYDKDFVQQSSQGFAAFQALVLEHYPPDRVSQITGVPAETIVRIAKEFATRQPGLAIGGDAAATQTNGIFNMAAINALNALVGNVGRPGGISFAPAPPLTPLPPVPASATRLAPPRLDQDNDSTSITTLTRQLLSGQPYAVNALLLYEANPLFSLPAALQFRQALEKIPFIASFSSFKDETTLMADLILPDHTYLESWWDEVPDPGVELATVGLAQPVVKPLYNTRSTPDVLLQTAKAIGGEVGAALPWETFDALLKDAYRGLHQASGSTDDFDTFWEELLTKGVWWPSRASPEPETGNQLRTTDHGPRTTDVTFNFSPVLAHQRDPEFAGDANTYPFYLHVYQSLAFSDGRGANQPWLQEMPDPMTTVTWGTWVEINPKTAAELSIREGDLVRVESPHGSLQAPALLFPGARPDTINMPVGQGHEAYGRYARHRGANPIQILAPLTEPVSGALAWAATRVKISKVGGHSRLIKMGYTPEHTDAGHK
jgi:anaerobic selenocysteine-containing dehydrogenase